MPEKKRGLGLGTILNPNGTLMKLVNSSPALDATKLLPGGGPLGAGLKALNAITGKDYQKRAGFGEKGREKAQVAAGKLLNRVIEPIGKANEDVANLFGVEDVKAGGANKALKPDRLNKAKPAGAGNVKAPKKKVKKSKANVPELFYNHDNGDIEIKDDRGQWTRTGLTHKFYGQETEKDLSTDQVAVINKMGAEVWNKLAPGVQKRMRQTNFNNSDLEGLGNSVKGDSGNLSLYEKYDKFRSSLPVNFNVNPAYAGESAMADKLFMAEKLPFQGKAKDRYLVLSGGDGAPDTIFDTQTGRPVQDSPSVPGARQAPNGKWYVEKNGQFFEVQ